MAVAKDSGEHGMTDLSREELKAHLSAVEAQVRAALRIVAAESKSVQQAHSALRADLSAALIRLQGDITNGNSMVNSRIDKLIADVDSLSRQRKMTTSILATLVLLFGISVGLLAGGSFFFFSQMAADNGMTIPFLSNLSAGGN